MSNFISRGLKGVRRALHLPPVTLGNLATKYAPAAAALTGVGGIPGAIAKGVSVINGRNAATPERRAMGAAGTPPVPVRGATANAYGLPSGAFGLPDEPPIYSDPGGGMPPDVGGSFPDPTQGGSSTPSGGGNWWDPIVSGIEHIGGSAVNYAENNPLEIAMGGLATMQGINSAKAAARQAKLQDEALALANKNWAAGQPLRDAGQAGLLKPRPAVDWDQVFADPTNPFAAKPRALGAPGAPVTTPPPVAPVPVPTGHPWDVPSGTPLTPAPPTVYTPGSGTHPWDIPSGTPLTRGGVGSLPANTGKTTGIAGLYARKRALTPTQSVIGTL